MDDLVKCVAYRVVAYGDRTAKLCVRADVADEWASNCRNEGAYSVEVQPLCEIAAATKELERLTAEREAAVLAEREELMPYFFIGQELSRLLNEGATITAERLPCLQPQADGSVLGNLKITYLTAIRAEPTHEPKEQK